MEPHRGGPLPLDSPQIHLPTPTAAPPRWRLWAGVLGLLGMTTGLAGWFWWSWPAPPLDDGEPLPHRFPSLVTGSVSAPAGSPCLALWTHSRSFEFLVRAHALGRPWNVRGAFRARSVAITLPTDGLPGRADVTLDAASIDSGNVMRDEHLRAPDMLDVTRHNDLGWEALSLDLVGQTMVLEGRLTALGHPLLYAEGQPPPFQAIVLRADAPLSTLGVTPVHLHGSFGVLRSAVGLTATATRTWDARDLVVGMDDMIRVTVDFQVRPCAPEPGPPG